jgi:hypothetical protein
MSLLFISLRLTASWLKPDKLSDNRSKPNSENTFKQKRIFTVMNHLSNGIKLQTLESLTHTLFIEKLMLEMVSNLEDGLTHSAGLIPVMMMTKLFFNSTNPSDNERDQFQILTWII